MNRTQEEILTRMKEVESEDVFGFQRTDLLEFLTAENAMKIIPDLDLEKFKTIVEERKEPKEQMIAYMPFAWEKANDKRGLSAMRSIQHYQAWLWLDGDEKLCKEIDDYEFYGKPQLIAICNYLGIDSSQWDDGVRENS
jgi:hypothetical protein